MPVRPPPGSPPAALLPEHWTLRANNHPGVLELSPTGDAGRVRIDAGRGWEVLDEASFDGTTLRFVRPLDADT